MLVGTIQPKCSYLDIPYGNLLCINSLVASDQKEKREFLHKTSLWQSILLLCITQKLVTIDAFTKCFYGHSPHKIDFQIN